MGRSYNRVIRTLWCMPLVRLVFTWKKCLPNNNVFFWLSLSRLRNIFRGRFFYGDLLHLLWWDVNDDVLGLLVNILNLHHNQSLPLIYSCLVVGVTLSIKSILQWYRVLGVYHAIVFIASDPLTPPLAWRIWILDGQVFLYCHIIAPSAHSAILSLPYSEISVLVSQG